jgi:hypothetical protein
VAANVAPRKPRRDSRIGERRRRGDDEAVLGGPVQDDAVARLHLVAVEPVVEAMHHEALARRQVHDDLGHRAEVDGLGDRPVHSSLTALCGWLAELDLLRAHRDLHGLARARPRARQQPLALAQVHGDEAGIGAVDAQ